MGKQKAERATDTLRSSELKALPPMARELAAKVLQEGNSEQWERSLVAILIVHERRLPGVSRSRSRMAAAKVIEDFVPPPSKRAA